ncbi:MAG: DUF5715 family protein [Patescibacteria group bacterium]
MDKQIIQGLDLELEQKQSAEWLRIRNKASVEGEWWGGKFQIHNIESALNNGQLMEVPGEKLFGSLGFRLIGNVRNGKESNLLRPNAYSLLQMIVLEWSRKVVNVSSDEVLLSVSSLFRTQEEQGELFKLRTNAAEISAHTAGAAMDFDPNGYFQEQKRTPVNRKKSEFKSVYIEELRKVLERFEAAGFCNVIFERGLYVFQGEVLERESCIHVCVSPEFEGL